MLLRVLLGLWLLVTVPAMAQEGCSTRVDRDCAAALRAVDAAIRADPWLAIMDQARAMRLEELLIPLGPEGAAELRRQDAAWRRSLSRDLQFNRDGTLDEPNPRAALRAALEYRLMQLIRIDPLPAPGIVGRWASAAGEVVVRRQAQDLYGVEIGTADIGDVAWTCEYDGEGRADRIDWLETDDGQIELRWLGTMLQIRVLTDGFTSFCGAAGSVAGYYFRVGDAD